MKKKEKLPYIIKTRKSVAWYFALILVLASIAGGILYIYYFSNLINRETPAALVDTFSGAVPALMFIGPVVFFILTFFKRDNFAMGVTAVLNFGALIAFILSIYEFVIAEINALAMGTEWSITDVTGFTGIVVVAAFQIGVMIFGNVLAWIRLNASPKMQVLDNHGIIY